MLQEFQLVSKGDFDLSLSFLEKMDYNEMKNFVSVQSRGGTALHMKDPATKSTAVLIVKEREVDVTVSTPEGLETFIVYAKDVGRKKRLNEMVPETVDKIGDMRGLAYFAKDEPFL